MQRRRFLQLAASAAAGAAVEHSSTLPSSAGHFSLRIAPVSVELAPGIAVHTTGYNGQSPGPVLRMREGIPALISVTNATEVPELVQWHGLHLSSAEGGPLIAPMIAPGATRTYRLTPTPSGTRWYHTHTMTFTDLQRAANSGQFGFLLIEPRSHTVALDQVERLWGWRSRSLTAKSGVKTWRARGRRGDVRPSRSVRHRADRPARRLRALSG